MLTFTTQGTPYPIRRPFLEMFSSSWWHCSATAKLVPGFTTAHWLKMCARSQPAELTGSEDGSLESDSDLNGRQSHLCVEELHIAAYHHHNYQRGMEEKLERNLVFLKSSCILILILFGWSKVSLGWGGAGQYEGEGYQDLGGSGGGGRRHSCGRGGQPEPLKLHNNGDENSPATTRTKNMNKT